MYCEQHAIYTSFVNPLANSMHNEKSMPRRCTLGTSDVEVEGLVTSDIRMHKRGRGHAPLRPRVHAIGRAMKKLVLGILVCPNYKWCPCYLWTHNMHKMGDMRHALVHVWCMSYAGKHVIIEHAIGMPKKGIQQPHGIYPGGWLGRQCMFCASYFQEVATKMA